jgi:hypothetical protein
VTVDGQSLDIDAETPARTITGAKHRLMEFASGRPDSRADAGTDWLRGLTDEQLRTVSGWIETLAKGGTTDGPREGWR